MTTSRPMHAATVAETAKPSVTVVYFVRLEIEGDPIYVWTGLGDKTLAGTGDAAIDGITFQGITNLIGEVGPANDARGGSAAMDLILPGVDLFDEAMRQVVYDRRRWQYRKAWVWLAFIGADGTSLVGNPVRLKTGRMDQMPVEEADDGRTGTVRCRIESQQAYAGEALATRYSETKELDPTDTSQDYVWRLANTQPQLGHANPIGGNLGGVLGWVFGGGRERSQGEREK